MQSLLACHASGSELIKVQQNKSYKVCMLYELRCLTLPETNSEFTPEKWWLEDEKILLGPGLSSGAVAMLVSGEGKS